MATNNYFGFTPGGTQYGAQPATAYAAAPAQTAYVQPANQTAAYATATARAPTYDAYQAATHGAATQYAYAARTQAQPTATYDTTKTYYTPAPVANAAAPATVYTVAETTYQATALKPASYTTAYTANTQQRTVIQPKVQATASYTYTSNPVASSSNNKSGSNYDAALYSAATTYYEQQSTSCTGGTTAAVAAAAAANSWKNNKGFSQKPKPKMPPKPPQLHYCEVCKISCAGPQTYREHLEGQKHKKKEAAAKTGSSVPASRSGQRQLRCELCDVTCTGSDAYAAHIRGAKHQKVLKLHTKLGKPIPSTEPTVVASNAAAVSSSAGGRATTATSSNKASTGTVLTSVGGTKKVLATPKITFVGGTQLKTTGAKAEEIKTEVKPVVVPQTSVEEDDGKDEDYVEDKDVTPVGHEYIEEVKTEFGKVVSFHCKLCECKFNDPNAKLMHMKGRRHRLQYKKKVDPSLQVEVKPSIRARKMQEEKARRFAMKEEYWRRRDAEERWREEMRMSWEQPYFGDFHGGGSGPGSGPGYGGGFGGPGGMPMRRPDTSDDRHVMAKHASIYPNEAELQAVQSIVSSVEKALKLVSDYLSEKPEVPKQMETETKPKIVKKIPPKPIVKEEGKEGEKSEEPEKETAPPRVLKGVMRVGVLAKGLLLHGDLNVHLVVLCSEKPTRTLLDRVADNLPNQLASISEEKFEVRRCVEEAAIIATMEKEPRSTCFITLTSPVMRDENTADGEPVVVASAKPDPPDVLDRQKCLDALAALRHAKWFQARANGLQSCVVVIRILRDLCQRVPTWTPLNQWAMELLVEKCVSSGGPAMSPGDALRRVFECIASGIFLPGGPGLYDPCEKEACDAAAGLTNQEREDITASAQHALRLIAFRQVHKVLGMDALPAPKFAANKRFNPRKRRRTNSTGEGTEAGEGDSGKKDKKEEEEK